MTWQKAKWSKLFLVFLSFLVMGFVDTTRTCSRHESCLLPVLTHMDDAVGQIIEALERTGQCENMLILFTSDNGGQFSWQSDTEYRGKYADKPHNSENQRFRL